MSTGSSRQAAEETGTQRPRQSPVSIAWHHLWRQYVRKVALPAAAVLLVAAGFAAAYARVYGPARTSGVAKGREVRLSQLWSLVVSDTAITNEGSCAAVASLRTKRAFYLRGRQTGWCLLRLFLCLRLQVRFPGVDSLTYQYLFQYADDPIADIVPLEQGREHSLNVDGTIWSRQRW